MDLKIGSIVKGKNNRLFQVIAIHNYGEYTCQDQYSKETGIQLKRLYGSNRKWLSLKSYIDLNYSLATEKELKMEKILYG